MPGVSVITATRSGRTAIVKAPSGTLFLSGLAERGSIEVPTLITGLADFEEFFGTRVSYSHLYDTVQTFFEEGGSRCYVMRVAGVGNTKGTLNLADITPATCLVVTPISTGAWSADIDIVVGVGGTTIQVLYQGVVKESFAGTTNAELIAAAVGSSWVVISAGTSSLMPVAGTFTMSAGDDKHLDAVAADYVAAVNLFDIALGDGAVAIPGIGTTVHAGLISHAVANRRLALLDMDETASVTNLTTQADTLNSEYAGLFAPWVKITTATGIRTIPPTGFVAAMRNRAHESDGAYRAPAGEIAKARYITGLATEYTRAQNDTLDAGKVNAIRVINNTIRNYGWRSLSDDLDNYSLLTGRDMLNRLVTEAEKVLEDFVFQSIDGKGHLLSAVNGTLVGVVEPYRAKGGLYEYIDVNGNRIDPGYLVETGSNINSLTNLANNEIKARLSVRISPSASLISVTIVKVGLISGL